MKSARKEEIIFRRIIIAMLSVLLITALTLLMLVITVGNTTKNVQSGNDNNTDTQSQGGIDTPLSDNTTEEITATVLNTGDILIHDNVLWGAEQSDGSYNFSNLFKLAKSYNDIEETYRKTGAIEITNV